MTVTVFEVSLSLSAVRERVSTVEPVIDKVYASGNVKMELQVDTASNFEVSTSQGAVYAHGNVIVMVLTVEEGRERRERKYR